MTKVCPSKESEQDDKFQTSEQKAAYLLSVLGMGGIQPVSSCDPNPCHPGVTCVVKPEGPECGPCPDGMQGNGSHCTDVDEVQKHDTMLSSHPAASSEIFNTDVAPVAAS